MTNATSVTFTCRDAPAEHPVELETSSNVGQMQLLVVVLAAFVVCTGILIGWSREEPGSANPKDQPRHQPRRHR